MYGSFLSLFKLAGGECSSVVEPGFKVLFAGGSVDIVVCSDEHDAVNWVCHILYVLYACFIIILIKQAYRFD